MCLKSKEKLTQNAKANRSWPRRRNSRFDAFYSLDALMYRVKTQKDGLFKLLKYVPSSQPAFMASNKGTVQMGGLTGNLGCAAFGTLWVCKQAQSMGQGELKPCLST